MLLAWLLAFALQGEPLERGWAAFEAAGAADLALRRAELVGVAGGPEAALAGMSGFGSGSVHGRRLRAGLVRAEGDARAIPAALAALGDPDPEVRGELVRFLGERRLVGERAAARVAALRALALDDAEAAVRAGALASLGSLADPQALVALEELVFALPADEALLAAARFAAHAGAREALVKLVVRVFAPEAPGGRGPAIAAEPLAILLRGYGDALVHVPNGGASLAELRPLVLGREHPAPVVRLAALDALEALVAGLARTREPERAKGLLEALGPAGLPPLELAYRRATLALTSSADPGPAQAAAEEILARTRGQGSTELREWRVRGALLGAGAAFAGGDLARADAFAGEALAVLEGLSAERVELEPSPRRPARGNVDQAAGYAHQACLVELWRAAIWLAGGRPADDAELHGLLRGMHVRQLKAAVGATLQGSLVALDGFQPLFDDSLGPLRLVLANPDLPAWPRSRALALEGALASALAGVSAFELPGFDPACADSDPLADPERRGLLEQILMAELGGVQNQLLGMRERAERDADKEQRLELRARILRAELGRLAEGEERLLRARRTPSAFAHELAQALLADGSTADARALCERMQRDLFAAGAQGAGAVQEGEIAALEATIGSSYMDAGEPAEAERVLLRAAARLEAYEAELLSNLTAGAGDTELQRALELAIASVRSQRSDVLLSLAVNANVRAGDPEGALRFFEQAFALKQNDFLRVLLACYRARSGRAAEARAVLAEVEVTPALYYNLACTYALLGERELALDFLARELAENHPSARARARQAQWAREDPDLRSLRDDPRFERVLGAGG
jgi:tetratricopeptide (TPR) repeat protein